MGLIQQLVWLLAGATDPWVRFGIDNRSLNLLTSQRGINPKDLIHSNLLDDFSDFIDTNPSSADY